MRNAICLWLMACSVGATGAGRPVEPASVRLEMWTEARSTTMASYRLQRYLAARRCHAELVFNRSGDGDLVYRTGSRGERPMLRSVNADGRNPVPVWVTRTSAGVGSLRELEGRDVALVAGSDPLSGAQALEALAAHGVRPGKGQRYEAGDFSSALGLLLHNNTHAAVSELGLVRPFLEPQGLTITWQGQPVQGAGWHVSTTANRPALEACRQALLELRRGDDRQIFTLFPEWVSGFAPPDSPP